MGPHRALYEAIRDRIQSELSWVLWTDLQKGQFTKIKENYPLPLPCVLVEIQPAKWKALLKNHQDGDTTVSLYIYLDHSGDSVSGSEGEEESLHLLNKMDEVFHKITGISTNYFQRLTRTDSKIFGYLPRIVIYRVDFQTVLYDHIPEIKVKLPRKPIINEVIV